MKLIDADDVINRIQQYSKKNNTLYEFSQKNVILLLQKAPEVNINDIKSEAVREFARRLKKKTYPFSCAIGVENAVTLRAIDELVKEMGCNDG